jgi:hydrogenase maturation protease
MPQTLVIGYGNLDRGDDGAAFHVVNLLRGRRGLPPLTEDEGGLGDLGPDAAVFVRQLLPELALDAADYPCIVLVDAHVTAERRPLVYRRLQPEYRPAAVGHFMPPAMFLWLLQAVSPQARSAFLVSVRGHCFELRRGLSAATEALIDPAVAGILKLIHLERSAGMHPRKNHTCTRKVTDPAVTLFSHYRPREGGSP